MEPSNSITHEVSGRFFVISANQKEELALAAMLNFQNETNIIKSSNISTKKQIEELQDNHDDGLKLTTIPHMDIGPSELYKRGNNSEVLKELVQGEKSYLMEKHKTGQNYRHIKILTYFAQGSSSNN